jgi:methylated-DNA-[protein]-cysteine S-methyltransferase
MTHYYYMKSPVGKLLLAGDEAGLKLIKFPTSKKGRIPESEWEQSERPFSEAIRQLNAYFDGKLKQFKLRLAPEGTPFQSRVWQALQDIPYGETISYGELAGRIGNPKAPRAVGGAVGRNPLAIVIPCHRVIGSDGGLTGFGGGLETKKVLLELERRHASLT